jgi:hypothetical protein
VETFPDKSGQAGFSIDNGLRILRDDEKGRESVAQYILRNPFSLDKMTYNDTNGTVIYRSKMTHGRNKKNLIFPVARPQGI